MTRKHVSLFVASLALATGLFWAKVLVAPSLTHAATDQGIDTDQLTLRASKNLPSFDDRHQAHLGVLDTLRPE